MPEKSFKFANPNPKSDEFRFTSITIVANLVGLDIRFQSINTIDNRTREYSFTYQAEDEESFILPDDLSRAERNMLIGVGQILMKMRLNGFPNE